MRTTPATIMKVTSGPGPAYRGAASKAAMPAPIELAAATRPWPVARSFSSVAATIAAWHAGDPIPWPKASIMANAISKIGDERNP